MCVKRKTYKEHIEALATAISCRRLHKPLAAVEFYQTYCKKCMSPPAIVILLATAYGRFWP